MQRKKFHIVALFHENLSCDKISKQIRIQKISRTVVYSTHSEIKNDEIKEGNIRFASNFFPFINNKTLVYLFLPFFFVSLLFLIATDSKLTMFQLKWMKQCFSSLHFHHLRISQLRLPLLGLLQMQEKK